MTEWKDLTHKQRLALAGLIGHLEVASTLARSINPFAGLQADYLTEIREVFRPEGLAGGES